MYSTTTALALQASTFADIGLLLVASVAAIIGAWAALVGLGFAKRHAQKYITGRKF